jgi:hypothetical protein
VLALILSPVISCLAVGHQILDLVFQVVPGFLVQLTAYIIHPSYPLLFSLVVSVLTGGYTSAVIALDIDADPAHRKRDPKNYGLIPDAAVQRVVNFSCMFLNSSLMMVIRCFGMVMLGMTGTKYALGYWACEQALFLLYKVAMRDLPYFIEPDQGCLGSVVFSILMRVLAKNVTDCTGNIIFRLPGELGGFYWILSMLMSIGLGYASVPIFFASAENTIEMVGIGEQAATNFMLYLGGAWLAVFVVFLLTMNREYWVTFFSCETGVQVTHRNFLNAENSDAVRMEIINRNHRHWTSIRPQVKEFIEVNWDRWSCENPDWLTADFKKRMGDDLIPPPELERLGGKSFGHERRKVAPFGLSPTGSDTHRSFNDVCSTASNSAGSSLGDMDAGDIFPELPV